MVIFIITLMYPTIPAGVLITKKFFNFRSPIFGYDHSGASYVGSGGSVGGYWDVTDSYG